MFNFSVLNNNNNNKNLNLLFSIKIKFVNLIFFNKVHTRTSQKTRIAASRAVVDKSFFSLFTGCNVAQI